MKQAHRFFLLGIFLFASPMGQAEAPDDTIDRLVEISGVSEQVENLPGLVKARLRRAEFEGELLPARIMAAMATRADELIVPAEMLSGIRTSLKAVLNDQEAQILLQWYESDPGEEILRAEEEATAPGASARMIKQAQALAVDKERVAIANRIDILRGTTELTLGIQEDVAIALHGVLEGAVGPDDASESAAAFEAGIAERREENRRAVGQMVILSMIYSYQDVDFGKLEKYEAFLEQPATVRFNETVMESLRREFARSTKAWVEAVAPLPRGAAG